MIQIDKNYDTKQVKLVQLKLKLRLHDKHHSLLEFKTI